MDGEILAGAAAGSDVGIDPHGPAPGRAHEALWPLISGVQSTQLVYVAAKLALADLLAAGPASSAAVAAQVGAHPWSLHRVMRGLVAAGLLEERADGDFALTPLGAHLRSDSPGHMRDWAIVGGELHYWAWGGLLHSALTGQPGIEQMVGAGMWEHLTEHPDLERCFHSAINHTSAEIAGAVVAAYDFSTVARVVDVGGGQGATLAAILAAQPHVRGVLYERPSVLEGAQVVLADQGVAERCTLVSGDFLSDVPGGGDLYLLKSVLHDWDDARAHAILANCRRAMAPDSRLLVIDMVMPTHAEDVPYIVHMDLHMLVGPGGRKRTLREHRRLFADAGLDLGRVIPTLAWGWTVLEGRHAQS